MNSATTGIVFDPILLKHDQPGHPENAKRLDSIINGLKEKRLHEKVNLLKSRTAEFDELALCHTKEYVEYVKAFCEQGRGYLDPDTYSNKNSFLAAATAVGSSIDLTKAVIKGELRNGFALLRPPGHHALANRSMGFCLFGNIAIAANVALTQPGIKRVTIVDFDVHHGNGTQALVGDDPNILFISSHQYPFYPGTGSIREIGQGDSEGTIVNIPLQAGVGDNGFKMVYEKVVIPSLDICAGKIIFFLEGGYNLEVLSNGVANSIRGLLGIESFDDPLGKSNEEEPGIERVLNELIKIHNL
jgi:acetoin utilization deacetylase AcuC-like enzyme